MFLLLTDEIEQNPNTYPVMARTRAKNIWHALIKMLRSYLRCQDSGQTLPTDASDPVQFCAELLQSVSDQNHSYGFRQHTLSSVSLWQIKFWVTSHVTVASKNSTWKFHVQPWKHKNKCHSSNIYAYILDISSWSGKTAKYNIVFLGLKNEIPLFF